MRGIDTRKQVFDTLALIAATGLVAVLSTSCSSTNTSSGSSTTNAGSTTSFGASTTVSGQTTIASTLPATTSTTDPDACEGVAGIPADAAIGATIYGDVDGDLANDIITEYSLDGIPHVHSQLASGGHSDTAVPIGNAGHVEVSFIDFDYSIGAPTRPPVAVLAIGSTGNASAAFTFLTNTIDYCIQPWHTDDGNMFVGRISAQVPLEGLFCDHAAGTVYNNLTAAQPDGIGGWIVTTRLLHHNFTLINIDEPQESVAVGTESELQAQYGDIVGCGHDPLFP